ncbi:ABC transporter permease [Actinomadura sp. HBU206391]|uniref:ABC transporter permease n=1 Tax=Actinomadura sp. HBU206391 TaxID=2731692 RepID=UPI00164F83BD|nr:ABC transporter permease [Actinomadura sp. HBU206391]MBC6458920.1 ABC transporter permease [Actinomadura sp. HBU206391]
MTRPPTALTAGAVTLAVVALGCFTLPLVSPHDPYRPDPMNAMLPPSPLHWLGTDQLGRDLLTRTAAAGRTSLLFALAVTTVTTAIGTVTGAIAGLAGGWPDRVLRQISIIALALPGLTLALVLSGELPSGHTTLFIALVPLGWVSCASVVRTVVRQTAITGYVLASRTMGASTLQLLRHDIAPHALGPACTVATADFARALIAATSLSFLGIGLPPPHIDWGGMINEATPHLIASPRLAIAPSIAIALTSLSIMLITDALRERTPNHKPP